MVERALADRVEMLEQQVNVCEGLPAQVAALTGQVASGREEFLQFRIEARMEFSAIREVLPTLATKDELRTLATKAELRTLATKDDLRTLATKDELRALATKDELRALATKVDLLAATTKEELRTLATKDELREAVGRLEAGIEESRRHATILFEDVRDDIRMVAEHLAGLIRGAGFRGQDAPGER